jgi:hypothetical protein
VMWGAGEGGGCIGLLWVMSKSWRRRRRRRRSCSFSFLPSARNLVLHHFILPLSLEHLRRPRVKWALHSALVFEWSQCWVVMAAFYFILLLIYSFKILGESSISVLRQAFLRITSHLSQLLNFFWIFFWYPPWFDFSDCPYFYKKKKESQFFQVGQFSFSHENRRLYWGFWTEKFLKGGGGG